MKLFVPLDKNYDPDKQQLWKVGMETVFVDENQTDNTVWFLSQDASAASSRGITF